MSAAEEKKSLIFIKNLLPQGQNSGLETIFLAFGPYYDKNGLKGDSISRLWTYGSLVWLQKLTDYWMKTALFRKWDGMGFRKIIGKFTKNHILVSDFYVGANWLNLIISADGWFVSQSESNEFV